jgi:hypothetical protein
MTESFSVRFLFRTLRPLFPPVDPDQFGLSEKKAAHCFLDLGLRCTGIQGQWRVQCVQFEEIPVSPKGGGERDDEGFPLQYGDVPPGRARGGSRIERVLEGEQLYGN